jgi:hypothetical protein
MISNRPTEERCEEMSENVIGVVSNDVLPTSPAKALLTLIGTTVFEVAGLVIWFELDRRNNPGLGLLILFFGLVLERLVVTGFPNKLSGWALLIGSSWWEYAAWGLWLTLITKVGLPPFWIFALVLFPGLHFQHAFLISVSTNKTYGELALHPGFILFSLIEAIGGALWLVLLTNTVDSPVLPHLFIFGVIAVEHFVQGVVLNSINQEGQLAQVAQAN